MFEQAKSECLNHYFSKLFPNAPIYTEYDHNTFSQLFRIDLDDLDFHLIKVAIEFAHFNTEKEMTEKLDSWRIKEHLVKAGRNIVLVTTDGICIEKGS